MTLKSKKIFLAGDSRSSNDYTFYKETLEKKTGAEVIVGGESGWNVLKNASDIYFERLTSSPHDFSLWLVGGNDIGGKGTVGTFSEENSRIYGEPKAVETDINENYSGTLFIQAIDHIMRKYKDLFYDWRKLTWESKPKMIFCTDLPQKRFGGDDTWSLKENHERKNRAIRECAVKNNVALLDLYTLCNFDMSFEPEWTAPTDMVNNNGLYFMDGLHPNVFGIDIITSLEIAEMKKYVTIL